MKYASWWKSLGVTRRDMPKGLSRKRQHKWLALNRSRHRRGLCHCSDPAPTGLVAICSFGLIEREIEQRALSERWTTQYLSEIVGEHRFSLESWWSGVEV